MIRRFFIIITPLIVLFACKKDFDPVPYIPIDLTFSLNGDLNGFAPGLVVQITPRKDSNGVYSSVLVEFPGLENKYPSHIQYKRLIGNGLYLYYHPIEGIIVFDRTCTHNAREEYNATHCSDQSKAVCPVCGSEFFFATGGSTIKGPANMPLTIYQSVINGNLLVIRN